MELRPYQESAIGKMRQAIRAGSRRIVFAMPTGSGKSIVFGQVIRNAFDRGNKILWLVHRRNLVIQFQKTLEDFFGVKAGVIMAGYESETDRQVQIGTIQTYGRRLMLDELSSNRFFINADLVLVDEAHRSVSKQYQDILTIYKEKFILGCTATPMRADGRGMGEVYDGIVDVVGVRELTDMGHLARARYFAAECPDLSDVKIAMGDYVVKDLERVTNKPKLVGDIVENWLKYGENRKTICFCVNVKHSIAVCQAFNNAGVNSEQLSARSTDEEREEVFKRMEMGNISVICNVALYQEGLDVPDVSCIIMARSTKSMGLWRQCAGRGLRPAGHPDCLIFDHGGVIEENGFLEDEIEWSLNGNNRAWKLKEKKEVEKKPVTCVACHLVFFGGNVCPDCGSPVKTFGRKIETADGELRELNPDTANRKYDWDFKRRVMGGFVWYERQKSWNPGRKAHLYRTLFGVWPNSPQVKNVPAIEPEGKVANMIKYAFIKSAKSFQKRIAA